MFKTDLSRNFRGGFHIANQTLHCMTAMPTMDDDTKHNQAIRDEIADRLRALLSREQVPVSPRLRQLLWRLDGFDRASADRVSLWIVPEIPASILASIPARLAGKLKLEPVMAWLHQLFKRS